MANEITSGLLASALDEKMINEAFNIARSNIQGILQTASMVTPETAYEGYKTSWMDFRIDATSSNTTAEALAAATTVSVADGAKFRAGMLVSPADSDEVLLVSAVTGNDLTVVRGFGGTTAATIASGTPITIDSVSREENSLAQNDGIFQPETVENFFQTMDTAVEMSRRALATLQFGDTNDLAFQVQERIRQLTIQMNRTLVRGRKATATVDSKERTFTGGIRYFLDQSGAINEDAAAATLTLDLINELNASIVARGGMANTIAVGINKARTLNALVSANYSSQRLGDWMSDEGSVMRLPTDLPLVGNVNTIVIDTNLNDDELIIYDSGSLQVVPMAANNAQASGQWRTVDATQPGQDGQRARIIGDFAMRVRQSKTHFARLHNIG